jgi:hypothetical protein
MKLSNQFRGLEADELQFLDEVAKEKKDKERMVKEQESEELRAFKYVVIFVPAGGGIRGGGLNWQGAE